MQAIKLAGIFHSIFQKPILTFLVNSFGACPFCILWSTDEEASQVRFQGRGQLLG
jgi:hypothetical protein